MAASDSSVEFPDSIQIAAASDSSVEFPDSIQMAASDSSVEFPDSIQMAAASDSSVEFPDSIQMAGEDLLAIKGSSQTPPSETKEVETSLQTKEKRVTKLDLLAIKGSSDTQTQAPPSETKETSSQTKEKRVTKLNHGIRLLIGANHCACLVEKGAILPLKLSYRVNPYRDFQRSIQFNFFLGDSAASSDNKALGGLTIEISPLERELVTYVLELTVCERAISMNVLKVSPKGFKTEEILGSICVQGSLLGTWLKNETVNMDEKTVAAAEVDGIAASIGLKAELEIRAYALKNALKNALIYSKGDHQNKEEALAKVNGIISLIDDQYTWKSEDFAEANVDWYKNEIQNLKTLQNLIG